MSQLAKMQMGTPFLRREVVNGKEQIQICIFQIRIDHKDPAASCLTWREQDGDGKSSEVPISNIMAVEEKPSLEDDTGSLDLSYLANGKTHTMELIGASSEDFETWRDGLRFIVDANRRSPSSPASQSRPVANSKAVVQKKTKTASIATAPAESTESATADILQRCQLQAELISELRQENGMLNGMMKQKDDAIAQLSRELRSGGTKTERCNKTELTSRESDDHLKDREIAILKRKNQRLKKMVQKKQKTIDNLMKTLQSALGNQTSDGEMLKTEDDGDDVDSDMNASMESTSRAQALAINSSVTDTRAELASDGSGSDIMMNEEVRALASKLEFMERAVAGLQPPPQVVASPVSSKAVSKAGANGFQPPPRNVASQQRETQDVQQKPAGLQSSPAVQKASPKAQQRSAAEMRQQMAKAPPQNMSGFDFSAVGGTPSSLNNGMSKGSLSALQLLAEEMQKLEEKKKIVEELARDLEPPSDNEDEDDGFPLQ